MHWRKGLECRRQFCEPVGAWFSQLGDLNVVHHMWTYPDLQTRKTTREDAWQVDGWAETVINTGKMRKAIMTMKRLTRETTPANSFLFNSTLDQQNAIFNSEAT